VVAQSLHLPEWWTVTVDRHPFPVVWAIVGAAAFVAIASGDSRATAMLEND
jgi:hypothetical protein